MKKYIVVAVVAMTAVALFTFFGTAAQPSVEIGKKAPAFTLKDVDGNEHALSDFIKSKSVVLMFIATQCPVSNDYNERMAKLHEEYATKGVTFVGINSNKQESIEEIKEHSATNNFKFVVLKDWNNIVADAYGAQFTPEIFVLNGDGVLQYHGRIDDARNAEKVKTHDLREVLDALLAGNAVSKTETKAFGCTIKRVKKDS